MTVSFGHKEIASQTEVDREIALIKHDDEIDNYLLEVTQHE